MSEWRPIETAPARQILVSDGANITIAYQLIHKHGFGGWWNAAPYSRALTWRPTHWMPLPEPPNA